MDTKSVPSEIMAQVVAPMRMALGNSNCLNMTRSSMSLEENYKNDIFQIESSAKSSIDQLLVLVHGDSNEGIPGCWANMMLPSLEAWVNIWNEVMDFSAKIGTQQRNLDPGDLLKMQNSLLDLMANGTKLGDKATKQLESMVASAEKFGKHLDAMNVKIRELRDSWVICAKRVAGNNDVDDNVASEQFRKLNNWSNFMELCYNTYSLYGYTIKSYNDLVRHFKILPDIITRSPAGFLDLYGSLLSGKRADIDDSKGNSDTKNQLYNWVQAFRFPDQDYREPVNHVFCGETYYNARNFKEPTFGDDPKHLNKDWANSKDFMLGFGIMGFDFGGFGRHESFRTGVKLGTRMTGTLTWEPDNEWCALQKSTMSWTIIPPKLREHVRFSFTELLNDGKQLVIRGPNNHSISATSSVTYDGTTFQWNVSFPKAFNTDRNIAVRLWILNFNSIAKDQYSRLGIEPKISQNSITKEGFGVQVDVPTGFYLYNIQIGYLAYEQNVEIPGFYESQGHLRPSVKGDLSRKVGGVYHEFPRDKFSRRPAVISMINGFSMLAGSTRYQGNTLMAASRDGIIIQGHSSSDITHLGWQTMAIAKND